MESFKTWFYTQPYFTNGAPSSWSTGPHSAAFLGVFFYKMLALFPLISWNNLISFPQSFSWVYNVGWQLLLQFGCF